MSEHFFSLLTGAAVLFWAVIFLSSNEVPSRKYQVIQLTVGFFALCVICLLLSTFSVARDEAAPNILTFRAQVFCLVASFLVTASVMHSSIFKERWSYKTLSLLTLSLGLACRAFLFDDILLTGTVVAVLLLLFSQAPLIAGRSGDREELTVGLFFFLIILAGFGASSGFFESGSGSLDLEETLPADVKRDAKTQLGWLFGFTTSVLVLLLPFFGLFQAGIHRARSWSIHNWLFGFLVLAGVSASLAWIDAADRLIEGAPHFSKVLCLLMGVILSSLAMVRGCFSRKVSAVFQAWIMSPLFAGFVAYALGTPEGRVLSVLAFALWIFGLVAVGGTLNLLGVETGDSLDQLSRRLLGADRFSRGLFLFSLALLSPIGSLMFMKVVTLTLKGDLSWAQGVLGGSTAWAFSLLFLFLVAGMLVSFVVPLMRVYPSASTHSNSPSSSRPLTWDQVKVSILLVPVIVVGIYSTHLYKYMAKTLEQ